MITVVDVIRGMGLEPTPDLTWSVGAQVRAMWEAENGELPEKRLRPKTYGNGGTHCLAVYPRSWWTRIADVVRAHQAEAARQMELF